MNRGIVKKIIWEKRGLQKGRLKKTEGGGPRNITFFNAYCSETEKVEKEKEYKYTYEVLDKDSTLKIQLKQTQKLISKKPGKGKKKRKQFKKLLKVFKKLEKGIGKKVAVDLEP